MAYQMAAATVKVIHRLHAFSNAIRRTFMQHFTQKSYAVKVCKHGMQCASRATTEYMTEYQPAIIGIFRLEKQVEEIIGVFIGQLVIFVPPPVD